MLNFLRLVSRWQYIGLLITFGVVYVKPLLLWGENVLSLPGYWDDMETWRTKWVPAILDGDVFADLNIPWPFPFDADAILLLIGINLIVLDTGIVKTKCLPAVKKQDKDT